MSGGLRLQPRKWTRRFTTNCTGSSKRIGGFARQHIVFSLVERYLGAMRRRLRICELGCGTGGNLLRVAEQHDVVGVECSRHALEYAKQSLGDRVRWGRLPDEIDLPPVSFDVVLLTDVLEHVEDDAASANTALALLRPGGIVVATVPAYQWLYSPRDAYHHHFRRYAKRQFRGLWAMAEAETLLLSHYNTFLFCRRGDGADDNQIGIEK